MWLFHMYLYTVYVMLYYAFQTSRNSVFLVHLYEEDEKESISTEFPR